MKKISLEEANTVEREINDAIKFIAAKHGLSHKRRVFCSARVARRLSFVLFLQKAK